MSRYLVEVTVRVEVESESKRKGENAAYNYVAGALSDFETNGGCQSVAYLGSVRNVRPSLRMKSSGVTWTEEGGSK